MQQNSISENPMPAKERFAGPIWTLLLLAPFLAEVVTGATRLSTLFAFVPEIAIWGVGALVSRELVRRWRAGWPSLLMLGLALSIAEEFLIQQTSIAPLPFPGAHADFGRWAGVNWVYFLFMLAFESVWVVLMPVKVTELLFPNRAAKSWLRTRSLIVCCVVFLLGCRVAWYAWIKRVRPMLHAAPYHPPIVLIALGALAILVLIALAWLLRGVGPKKAERGILPAWAIGVMSAIASLALFQLLGQIFQAHPSLSAETAVGCEVMLAVVMLALFAMWTGSTKWNDRYAWAACFGASLSSCMNFVGFTRLDAIFKIAVDLLSVIGFLWLGARVHKQQSAAEN
jgi:hypothetical protein